MSKTTVDTTEMYAWRENYARSYPFLYNSDASAKFLHTLHTVWTETFGHEYVQKLFGHYLEGPIYNGWHAEEQCCYIEFCTDDVKKLEHEAIKNIVDLEFTVFYQGNLYSCKVKVFGPYWEK